METELLTSKIERRQQWTEHIIGIEESRFPKAILNKQSKMKTSKRTTEETLEKTTKPKQVIIQKNEVRPVYFKRLHVKSEGVWCLSFQEEYLSKGWYGNLDSSMVKSARLEIWRSVVQIPVQVQIFL